MKSKKILAVLMAAGMTLSLAACGSSSDSTDKSADNGSDSGKTYKIGILQQLEHAALDEATKGFEDACTEKFGEGNVKFDLQNGQGEHGAPERCTKLLVDRLTAELADQHRREAPE